MNNIKILRAKKKDIDDIKLFMLKIIKEDFGYDFNPDWHWDIDKLEHTYLSGNSFLSIAVDENANIIGTIAGRVYDKKFPQFDKQYSSKTFSIWRHYIKKEYRGQGIGSQLLKNLEEFCKLKGFNKIYLHTQKTIPGSLEYWLKKGYYVILDSNDDFQTVHLEKNI